MEALFQNVTSTYEALLIPFQGPLFHFRSLSDSRELLPNYSQITNNNNSKGTWGTPDKIQPWWLYFFRSFYLSSISFLALSARSGPRRRGRPSFVFPNLFYSDFFSYPALCFFFSFFPHLFPFPTISILFNQLITKQRLFDQDAEGTTTCGPQSIETLQMNRFLKLTQLTNRSRFDLLSYLIDTFSSSNLNKI